MRFWGVKDRKVCYRVMLPRVRLFVTYSMVYGVSLVGHQSDVAVSFSHKESSFKGVMPCTFQGGYSRQVINQGKLTYEDTYLIKPVLLCLLKRMMPECAMIRIPTTSLVLAHLLEQINGRLFLNF